MLDAAPSPDPYIHCIPDGGFGGSGGRGGSTATIGAGVTGATVTTGDVLVAHADRQAHAAMSNPNRNEVTPPAPAPS